MTQSDPFKPSEQESASTSGRDGFPLFAVAVEAMTSWASAQMHLFATSLGMVRNFHGLAWIPPLDSEGIGVASGEERQSVVESERDGRLGIDLKFGSITFKKEEAGSFAVALVDVIVNSEDGGGTRVQMETKVPVDAAAETVLGVTEKSRAHIVATLRGAADTFDAMSADTLLFHDTEPGKG